MNYFSDSLLFDMMDGNQVEINDIAKMFIELAPQMISEIELAINNQEWEKAGDAAHKLKSSVGLWKIDSALSHVLFIEINGRKNINTKEIESNFQKLVEILDLAIGEMKSIYL